MAGHVHFLNRGGLVLVVGDQAPLEDDQLFVQFPRVEGASFLNFRAETVWECLLDFGETDKIRERNLWQAMENAVDAALGGASVIQHNRYRLNRNVQDAGLWVGRRIAAMPQDVQRLAQGRIHLFWNGNVLVRLMPRNGLDDSRRNDFIRYYQECQVFGIYGEKYLGQTFVDVPPGGHLTWAEADELINKVVGDIE